MSYIDNEFFQASFVRQTGKSSAPSKTATKGSEIADGDFTQIMAEATKSVGQKSAEQPQIAPPGGSSGVANDLLRLLGAKNEGSNATSAANGQATAPESFFAQMLRSASGTGESNPDDDTGKEFSRYLQGMINKAYS